MPVKLKLKRVFNKTKELLQDPRSKPFERIFVYLLLCLMLVHETTRSALVEECSGVEASGSALSREDYSILTKFTYRKPSNRKVVLVTLTEGKEPDEIFAEPCTQRLFMARLISRLNEVNAAVIALDKFYGRSACDVGGNETKALIAAVANSRAPITRGLPTTLFRAQDRDGRRVCLRHVPTLQLPVPAGQDGVLRLDADTRRIPLAWPVLQQDGKAVREVETLAWVTAQTADRSALQTFRLSHARKRAEPPYSAMIEIPTVSAIDLLCGKGSSKELDWSKCEKGDKPEELNGAIAVVGEHYGDADLHPTMGGFLYCVDLQANYIASLLDDRYYVPVLSGYWNEFAVFAFFCIVVGLATWTTLPKAFAWTMAIWGGMVIASVLFATIWGYLLTFWVQFINLAAVAIIFFEHWLAGMHLATPTVIEG
jgi:CHASE2 domain-containing sensor protein